MAESARKRRAEMTGHRLAALGCAAAALTVGAFLADRSSFAEAADQAVPNAARLSPEPAPWAVPDVDALPMDAWGRTVRFGRALTVETFAHLGPEAADPARRFAGNNLACQSCHLEAGTRRFGLPFVGVFADFPEYRAREGDVATIEDRVNGCMTRSMNGRKLPFDSPEMKGFVAYIKFLSNGRPIGGATPGRGAGKMPELTRAADPVAGKAVFDQSCAGCHGAGGQGTRADVAGGAKGYLFPPLWGSDSFNDGAGMARLISAANFIHSNMPPGATHNQPVLSVEDAWDVAAYVISQNRPVEPGLGKDYPVPSEKAVDAGYGPFDFGFAPIQHKYGPFQPIRDKIKASRVAPAPNRPLINDQ